MFADAVLTCNPSMLRTSIFGVALLLVGANARAQSSTISFSRDVLPILQDEFAPLLEREAGLSLESWATLMAGSDYGEVVIPFDADGSLLMRLATQLDDMDPLSETAANVSETGLDRVRTWINQGAPDDDGTVAYADAENLLYATIQGAAKVAVIDMDANVVIRTIDLQSLGFGPNARPHHVAVEADGSAFYVSLIGEDTILKFDRSNEVVARVPFERPGMLVAHPDRDDLFVGRSMMAVNPPQRIGRITRSTMEVEELDVFIARPHAIAVHPHGEQVYVGSLAENRWANMDYNSIGLTLLNLEGPTHTLVQFAVSPDGNTLVAGGQMTGQFFFFDSSNWQTVELADTIRVGAAPWHPVFSPDGTEVWIGNKMANTATVIDVASRSVSGVIEGLHEPHGAAISADGRTVYFSNNNLDGSYAGRYVFRDGYKPGAIAVIDTETRTIRKMLEVGPYPTGLGTRMLEVEPRCSDECTR